VISVGQRDKLVTIQSLTDSVDATGAPVQVWATFGSAWMQRRVPIGRRSGDERFTADQLTAPEHAQWEMVKQSNMDPEVVDVTKLRRLLYRGWTYDIVAAEILQREEGESIVLTTLGRRAS
jgi:head-tail adaptor